MHQTVVNALIKLQLTLMQWHAETWWLMEGCVPFIYIEQLVTSLGKAAMFLQFFQSVS